jgi:hypothetical protein
MQCINKCAPSVADMLRYSIPDLELRQKLAEQGLQCHLLVAKTGPDSQNSITEFPKLLCKELEGVLESADSLPLSPAHLQFVTWGVTLSELEGSGPDSVVACSALSFYSDLPSYFHTRFEAVRPSRQRTGLGRTLYDCIAIWARFLILNDPIVLEGILRSSGDYCIVSVIDADEGGGDCDDEPGFVQSLGCDDNQAGHGTFLKRLGFVRAVHDFRQDPDSEIAFQLDFHVPVCPDTQSQSVSGPLVESAAAEALKVDSAAAEPLKVLDDTEALTGVEQASESKGGDIKMI